MWVSRFKQFLLIECGLADSTLEAYGRDLREFTDHLARLNVSLAALEYGHLQKHLIGLKDRGLALASIARRIACLRMFLKYLQGRGVITADIAGRRNAIRMPIITITINSSISVKPSRD